MKSDRNLTLTEVFANKFTIEYLDKKEKKAIISRHLYNLSFKRDALTDKIKMIGETENLKIEFQKLNDKMLKLQHQYDNIKL